MSGREPRPISTSRQPVLPLMVSSRPPSLCWRSRLSESLRRALELRFRALGAAKNLDPAGSVLGLIGPAIEADDFRAAQAAGEADRQNGAVAQAAQIHLERRQHRQQFVGEDRLLLDRRAAMGAANAGEHRRNMPIARVERLAALAVTPANAGEPALQRSETLQPARRPRADSLHAGGEIEADGLRVRGQGIEALPAQPGGELPPIGVIGASGVVGAGVAGVIAGFFGERREMGEGAALRASAAALCLSSAIGCRNFWDCRALESLDFPVA